MEDWWSNTVHPPYGSPVNASEWQSIEAAPGGFINDFYVIGYSSR